MANGYIVAAEADIAAARVIAEGFDLEVISAGAVGEAAVADLAGASNVGFVLSAAAAEDANFTALAQTLVGKLETAQLILVAPEARAAFPYLPQTWPSVSLEQARARSLAMREQRLPGGAEAPTLNQPSPVVPTEETPAEHEEAPPDGAAPGGGEPVASDSLGGASLDGTLSAEAPAGEAAGAAAPDVDDTKEAVVVAKPKAAEHAPPAQAPTPAPVTATPAPAPMAPSPRADEPDAAKPVGAQAAPRTASQPASAPADATAFAPRKLRRGTPELVRIAIHQPKDLAAVVKAARKVDPRAEPAPSSMRVGEVPLGSSVAVSLESRGAACDEALQRRTWEGQPIDFSFSVEADGDVEQAVFLARVFVDDAQIGVLAFTRPISGAAKKAAHLGDSARLKRHKRVFLSYSSQDRETVAAIATAYQSAGVAHFWDRTALKSGEEWSPRLRQEIERADLFHLCWSKSAAQSQWVEMEAEYALTRRHRSGRAPDITVQMLDGPPWAPHPRHLDAINFDDFVRAAIVGYARGDGSA
jgi:hypothetical protein